MTMASAHDAISGLCSAAITALESSYHVTCVLYVCNDTEWELGEPTITVHNGCIKEPPGVIRPKATDVIGAHKRDFSVFGCGATMAWKVKGAGIKVEINFGIAGGGVSWFNSNHLQLRILDEYDREIAVKKNKYDSGGSNSTTKVHNDKISIEGMMGDTDHARVKIYVRSRLISNNLFFIYFYKMRQKEDALLTTQVIYNETRRSHHVIRGPGSFCGSQRKMVDHHLQGSRMMWTGFHLLVPDVRIFPHGSVRKATMQLDDNRNTV